MKTFQNSEEITAEKKNYKNCYPVVKMDNRKINVTHF